MIPEATERLVFRHFGKDDFPLVEMFNSDPAVMKYVGGVKHQQEIPPSFQKYLNYHTLHPGFGYWCAFLKSNDKFVGMYLVKVMEETGETEIGYLLLPEFWGQGLASEGAQALIRYCKLRLGAKLLVGITDPMNKGSRNVLEKAGFSFVKYGQFKQTTCAYYRMHCDE
jgi:RimJ/RimL family protein N-acetyltransferase